MLTPSLGNIAPSSHECPEIVFCCTEAVTLTTPTPRASLASVAGTLVLRVSRLEGLAMSECVI